MENSFTSLEEMTETLRRGNEIEFSYEGKDYYILPEWDNGNICGYQVGEAYCDSIVYSNEMDLGNHIINGKKLKNILSKITIKFRNF
jgi:hypothetical protein